MFGYNNSPYRVGNNETLWQDVIVPEAAEAMNTQSTQNWPEIWG